MVKEAILPVRRKTQEAQAMPEKKITIIPTQFSGDVTVNI